MSSIYNVRNEPFKGFFNSYRVKIYSLCRPNTFSFAPSQFVTLKVSLLQAFDNLRSSAIGFETEVQLYYVCNK